MVRLRWFVAAYFTRLAIELAKSYRIRDCRMGFAPLRISKPIQPKTFLRRCFACGQLTVFAFLDSDGFSVFFPIFGRVNTRAFFAFILVAILSSGIPVELLDSFGLATLVAALIHRINLRPSLHRGCFSRDYRVRLQSRWAMHSESLHQKQRCVPGIGRGHH